MRITQIKTYLVEIPYRSVYVTATNHTKAGRHVVVQLQTDSGISGWGETGIISRGYPAQGDTPEGMVETIRHYLSRAIIGMNPLEIERVLSKMDSVLKGNHFAKCAIDHALFDIAGKALNVPATTLLGGVYQSAFYVSRSLPVGKPGEVATRASKLADDGYTCLTLKCGIDYRQEIDCLKAVRKAVGPRISLEVDANGGYDRPTALKAIREMEEFEISAVEQPLVGPDLVGMADLRAKINTPLIADESVFNIDDLTKVIKSKAADIICLKPFKSGGLLVSKKMESITRAFNLGVSTGSMHPFGIGTAALHQFIATLQNVVTTGYGSPTERFIDDIVDEACFDFSEGKVTLHDRPGLGVVVNEDKLEKYSTKIFKNE